MRREYLMVIGFVLILLVMIGTGSKAHGWDGWQPMIMIQHAEPVTGEITRMVLDIGTTNPDQAEDVQSIRAWNTNLDIDPTTYKDWYLWNSSRKTYTTYEFIIETDYKATLHYGAYNVEVKYKDDTTETFTTPFINPWADRFPPPGGLEVDYSSGPTTPTFRFMPVDDDRIDYYGLRVRYYEGPKQVRMTYRIKNIEGWVPGEPVEVIYLGENMSDGHGTEEPLKPGIEYHVRVEAYDQDGASFPSTPQAFFRSEDRLYFSLDQDGDGILDLVDTAPDDPSNEEFADAATTSGEIISRGNQRLIITNQPDPEGVRIIASITGEYPPATVSACGGAATYTLTAGDQMIVTCGSVETKILHGTVEITFVGDDGTPATTSLDAGNSLAFEPTTFTFSAPPTNSDVIVVVVEGKEFSIAPGEGKTIVNIDIEPRKDPNYIFITKQGCLLPLFLPVAILSTEAFYAPDEVDTTSLTFGSTGDEESLAYCAKYARDVNDDGHRDLICYFETNKTGFRVGDIEGILKGQMVNGNLIEGRDAVRIISRP